MRLDDARAEFRARRPLEAIDFGAHIARAHAWPIARAIGVYSLAPTLVSVGVLLASGAPLLAALAIFWLRPLDARIAVLVASRGLFGVPPTLAETGRLLATEGRRGALWDFTLGRLSIFRAVTLPSVMLEGSTGARRVARTALFARGLAPPALALACLAFEGALVGGGAALVDQAVRLDALVGPASLEDAFEDGPSESDGAGLAVILYALAAPLGETLLALGGFALYLNRRTLLEGWDIELVFRRLGRRAGAAVFLLAVSLSPQTAAADSPDPEVTRRTVEAVLARPEFGETVVRTRFEPRFGSTGSKREPPARTGEESALALIFAYAALGALLVVVIVAISRALPWLGSGEARDEPPGGSRITELDLADARGELRPRELVERARTLVSAGHAREALALLYGGAIAALALRHDLEISTDATESECVRAVGARAPEGDAERFSELTAAFQLAAYADRVPPSLELERILASAPALLEGAE